MIGFNSIHYYATPLMIQSKPIYLLKPFEPFFRNCRPLSGLVLLIISTYYSISMPEEKIRELLLSSSDLSLLSENDSVTRKQRHNL